MILQALANYYDVLLDDPESGVSPPGYSRARISYAAVLSQEGELTELEDLRIANGKKTVARDMVVPEQTKRAVNICPNFLCDNSTYVFGFDAKGKPERTLEAQREFRKLHLEMLKDLNSVNATAVFKFIQSWHPERFPNYPCLVREKEGLEGGANIIFRVDGQAGYVHEDTAIRSVWKKHKSENASDIIGQCLITGECGPIARLHPSIKGIAGGQPTGGSIVSFNLSAFTSYEKEQSFNAPISEDATFAYTTALNYLLGSDRHRIRIGDTTAVFWAEHSTGGMEESLFVELFDPVADDDAGSGGAKEGKGRQSDPMAARKIKQLLERLKMGEPIFSDGFNTNTRFYILGLAPNAARLSIRFWLQDTFGELIERMLQHQLDMALDTGKSSQPLFAPWKILREAAANKDTKNISPLLAGNLARSIFSGQLYGESIFTHMISRIRSDGEVNAVRAGMIKACMKRKARKQGSSEKEAWITVSLNEENNNTGYRLGRLFAVMEKTQQDASPGLNATIKDRYFGAASATPGSVFPILLRLSQHHLSKAEYGRYRDQEMQQIMDGISAFPSHLCLEDQGQFVLGYYHQKQAIYTKKNEK